MCTPIIRKKIVNSFWSPFILFSFIILCAFILILCFDTKTSLTASIALIALGFAIFQFWVGDINTNRRRLYDLRFIAIKEINENYTALLGVIDKYRAINNPNKDELYYEINIKINTFNINLANSIEFLFQDISNKIEYKYVIKQSSKFSQISTQFRTSDMTNSILNETQKKMAWDNGMYDVLIEFSKSYEKLYYLLKNNLMN